MAYTVSSLTVDVLPRLSQPANGGISIIQAINSIYQMIHKRLLSRKSDLVAKGDLAIAIAAQGYYGTLPIDFIAMAERPYAEEQYTDWMAGTVTSYDSVTGELVASITDSSGTDELSSWNIATAALPGTPSEVVGTSTSTITVGTGAQTLTITTGLSITAGDYLYIFPTALPDTLTPQRKYMEPSYLSQDDDPNHGVSWWEWSGAEPSGLRPTSYRVIDTTFYIRPKVISNIVVRGKYFQSPTALTSPVTAIPYRNMFDEVFREGVVMIINSGKPMDANQEFMAFIHRQVDSVINTRISLTPVTRRMGRANYM